MAIRSFRELDVWKESMGLVVQLYAAAKMFPREEVFGLVSQLQRAAVSVPANIAEGQARMHRADFVRHLAIARGSLAEAETHVRIAEALGYLSKSDFETILSRMDQVGRQLSSLIRSLQRPAPRDDRG